jgi:hypothetical protein
MISAANYSVADFPQTALGAVRPSYGTSNGVSGPLSSSPIIPGRGCSRLTRTGICGCRGCGSKDRRSVRSTREPAGDRQVVEVAGRCGGLSRGLVAWALAKRAAVALGTGVLIGEAAVSLQDLRDRAQLRLGRQTFRLSTKPRGPRLACSVLMARRFFGRWDRLGNHIAPKFFHVDLQKGVRGTRQSTSVRIM